MENILLDRLYKESWADLSAQLNREENQGQYVMPFFIKAPEIINDPQIYKIMIFGQETWGWYDHCSLEKWIEIGMNEYERFFLKKGFYSGYRKSSFWQKFRFFEKELSKIIIEQGRKPVFIWNNISKIGNSDGKTGVSDNNRSIERQYFNVIAKEVEIIKPDLCIFMTGPNRDHDIKFNFPDASFKIANDIDLIREMALIDFLNIKGLRLYHPSFFAGFNNKYKMRALNVLKEIL